MNSKAKFTKSIAKTMPEAKRRWENVKESLLQDYQCQLGAHSVAKPNMLRRDPRMWTAALAGDFPGILPEQQH